MENWRRFKILNEEIYGYGSAPKNLTSKHMAALGRGIEKYPKFKHLISKAKMDPKYGSLPDDWGHWIEPGAGHHTGRVTADYQSALFELSQKAEQDPDKDILIQVIVYYVTKLAKKKGIVADFLKDLPGQATTQDRKRAKI